MHSIYHLTCQNNISFAKTFHIKKGINKTVVDKQDLVYHACLFQSLILWQFFTQKKHLNNCSQQATQARISSALIFKQKKMNIFHQIKSNHVLFIQRNSYPEATQSASQQPWGEGMGPTLTYSRGKRTKKTENETGKIKFFPDPSLRDNC